MQRTKKGDVTYCRFDKLSGFPEVVHGVFGRGGGVSQGYFASLNASFTIGDDQEAVVANRRLLCQALGIPYTSLVVAKQVHGTHVAIIDEARPVESPEEWYDLLPPSDGIATSLPGVNALMTFADCVPLLFFDPTHRAIGIAHGGWKGTVAKVAEHMVEEMRLAFATNPAHLVVAIGPSIGPCCYEVREDVISAVRHAFTYADDLLVTQPNGSVHFDLWEANRRQALRVGVLPEHVEVARICTACNTDVFFSNRAEKGKTGRFGVVIGLR